MDVIYTNINKEDVGVLSDYAFDLAFGEDENNFELSINANQHCCEAGCMIYVDGEEYGGIIDSIKVVTKSNEVMYTGRTWHGILASKIITPDSGQAYLTLSGQANALIGSIISRVGLGDLFTASTASSVYITNYKMNRYVDAYTGIRKMLATVGEKLKFTFSDGKVVLSSAGSVDYSRNGQFDSDQIEMEIGKTYHPVNHLICLGSGELTARQVVHLYTDASGNVSTTQTFTGIDEVAAVYDYPNAESLEDLTNSGIEKIQEYATSDYVKMDFDADSQVYDIGDTVGAKEIITGMEVKEKITKKIVSISRGYVKIEYKVGD